MSERAVGINLVRCTVLLASLAGWLTLQAPTGPWSQPEPAGTAAVPNQLPRADAGRDVLTYASQPTRFAGDGASADGEIVAYEWDFDGDGRIDFRSARTGLASHVYHATGTYQAVLRVHDALGGFATDAVTVVVKKGTGGQTYLPAHRLQALPKPPVEAPGDGLVERYAVMINGGYETRFWEDVVFMYPTLTDDYDFSVERILLFNHDGADPDGNNPGGMIDDAATLANIDVGFAELSSIMDGDDELFVWVTDHGQGYNGPQLRSYGYLGSRVSVDAGDEQDYVESEFKLRSLCTYGDYAYPTYNHGMDVFKVYRRYSSSQGAYQMYRNRFVSTFTDLYFEGQGVRSDADVYIERLIDYLRGDTDRDGYLETDQGEVVDYDGDGNPPYDHATGAFDEDDWGDLDYYDDNFNNINSGIPGDNYLIFDDGFDNHLDIDFDYDPANLQVDGTDLDNEGLFDGIDVNQDGDMDDWVSIDEAITLPLGELYDDELAILLGRIPDRVVSVFMEPCFSGGFVNDLSGPKRVISTATEEETVSYGNLFAELFTSAFHGAAPDGTPVDADSDGNGHVSMREAFNYAAENDYYSEVPQYDDNGDGLAHPHPIPQEGDGDLGGTVYLDSFFGLELRPLQDGQSADAGQTVTHTLWVTNTGNVTGGFEVTVGDHTWPVDLPGTVGPLAPDEGAKLLATVDVPADAAAAASDVATVTLTSLGDGTKSATATLTTTANAVCGVTVAPVTDTRSGDPGETVSYTLQVGNTGNVTDTFGVSIGGQAWQTGGPDEVGPLAAGESAEMEIIVVIPADAAGGASDVASVNIASRGQAEQWLQVTARWVSPLSASRENRAGMFVARNLRQAGVPSVMRQSSAGQAEGGRVARIPTGPPTRPSEVLPHLATSTMSHALCATATLTTTVNAIYGVMLDATADAQLGSPGETVTYTLRVTNSGGVADVVDLGLKATHTWEASLSATSLALDRGQSAEISVNVQIPSNARPGDSDVVSVTATSRGDPQVGASLSFVTTVKQQMFLPVVAKSHW